MTTATDDDPLILWMLSLTPTERLRVAQGFVDSLQAFWRESEDKEQRAWTLRQMFTAPADDTGEGT